MKNNKHEHNLTPDQERDLFSKLELPYSRSKSEVWDSLEEITTRSSPQTQAKSAKIIFSNWTSLSIAASVVLLIGFGLFANLYTTTIKVAPGEFRTYTLPDGSEVHLNAESTISYAPYWWNINRGVQLEGEAFFEVAKGNKFSVHSDLGTTEVLGTTFNILARNDEYQVYCVTGKVKVSSDLSNHVILKPGEFVKLDRTGLLNPIDEVAEESILSWRLNKFIYNTTPLTKVFEDVERHYNIRINLNIDNIDQYHYTALFKRSATVEETLEIICHSFDLTFEKDSDNSYVIKGD